MVAESPAVEQSFRSTKTGVHELLFWIGIKLGGFGLMIALTSFIPLALAWGVVLWFYLRYEVSYSLPFGKKVRRTDSPTRYWIGFGAQAAVFALFLAGAVVEILNRLGVLGAV